MLVWHDERDFYKVTKTTQHLIFNGVFTYPKKILDIRMDTGSAGEIIFL